MTRYPWFTSHLRNRSSCVLLPEPSMPSTMISRPGSPSAGRGTSGATVEGSNFETEAECPFGAASWRLERPRVNNWRNQRDMPVAAFEGGCIQIGATVPHQSIGECDRRRDLLYRRLIDVAEQRRPGLDAGLSVAYG